WRVGAPRRAPGVSWTGPRWGSKGVVRAVKGHTGTRRPRAKRVFDLVLTPGGIRRRVIECHTSVHRCLGCGEEFIPARYHRLDRHLHGLKSWAMYQHITHRLSLRTISTMLEEFFGFRVQVSELQDLKALMARKYRASCRGLLR